MNNQKNARVEAFPLSEYLVEEMISRDWTTVDVALRMGSRKDYQFNKIMIDLIVVISPIREKFIIRDEVFHDLAKAFGVSDQFFKNIHNEWLSSPDNRAAFECPEYILGPESGENLSP